MSYTITNQLQLRAAFWEAHEKFEQAARRRGTLSKGQNAQTTDTRMAWVDFVDAMCKGGQISPELAEQAVL